MSKTAERYMNMLNQDSLSVVFSGRTLFHRVRATNSVLVEANEKSLKSDAMLFRHGVFVDRSHCA
jgi:hypothetical protein